MSTRRFLLAVGSPIALLALFAALAEPSLFLWYLGIAWFLFGAGGIAAALMQGGRVVELENLLADTEDDVADLTAALAEATAAQAAVGVPLRLRAVAERPDLRVIPPQSTGEHDRLPVADEPTPIHDRALIDAWIEDVQTWGEDA
jgi:hypothetical protein